MKLFIGWAGIIQYVVMTTDLDTARQQMEARQKADDDLWAGAIDIIEVPANEVQVLIV